MSIYCTKYDIYEYFMNQGYLQAAATVVVIVVRAWPGCYVDRARRRDYRNGARGHVGGVPPIFLGHPAAVASSWWHVLPGRPALDPQRWWP
ncbi:hypothetical protein EDB86DRAFT_2906372 [Lactarius hatsudake]|nr:hypothetical protein EDB86DRAFT_2906372 [Lactarius hatsudake]